MNDFQTLKFTDAKRKHKQLWSELDYNKITSFAYNKHTAQRALIYNQSEAIIHQPIGLCFFLLLELKHGFDCLILLYHSFI